ncbi:MAG: nitroreductase family protein [Chitinophagales bacterium]|nr:nitroreductase family protein [Bacteroidota bacterium]MCB9042388.1 nitroreductase family protein [Chitinophagales bacterium]
MNKENFIPYTLAKTFSEEEMLAQVQLFYTQMNLRRSLRHFSDRKIAKEVIETIIKTAGTAPSGAHKQPWFFVAISNTEIKKAIREAAEEEEYRNYHGRMSEEWLNDLAIFETDWHKEFLETAPWLIVVFRRAYEIDERQQKHLNYYVNESVGLAVGFLLAAIHQAGLVALTHTPSPMNFLQKILQRPENEKPFLLIPVGYPAEDALVPNIFRKDLAEIALFLE